MIDMERKLMNSQQTLIIAAKLQNLEDVKKRN